MQKESSMFTKLQREHIKESTATEDYNHLDYEES